VTGSVVDPSDPKVIYISTAGGGAWKTKDGGLTWLPLFDFADPNAPLRGGAIAMDPDDPRVLVYGSGEANNSGDSYAGTGVYISMDSGKTWASVTDATSATSINIAASNNSGQGYTGLTFP